MFLKKKKNIKKINCYNYFFLKKFISRGGCIFFKKRYKILKNSFKRKIEKCIKRLRYLSIFPYNFKHLEK